ncbi:ComF family protein [Carboxylicivirga taeanensis]|uniref:ComF family protein n=1 Tax=Carboxylicivirga taeanensis TaxID=1416875 RepID=UPI003F6DAFD1
MRIASGLVNAFSAISELFYPPVCSGCGGHLLKHEKELCGMCMRRLPRTYFERRPYDNQISALMWGRCRVEMAFALFFYRKGERVQYLLQELKYRGNRALGTELGRQLGKVILQVDKNEFDILLPIPLHPKKMRQRGFNQAEIIAGGLSDSLQLPVNTSNVYRNTHTSTQTKKGRFERWQNVENIFSVQHSEQLRGKHILLIDDVITTGSTMEACINELTFIEGVRVSVASIACAVL